ncbi:hypothetical protein AB3S75_047204 [Citrus x aurantiifolia]
MRLVEQKLL